MVWQGKWAFDECRAKEEAQGLEAQGISGGDGLSRGPAGEEAEAVEVILDSPECCRTALPRVSKERCPITSV